MKLDLVRPCKHCPFRNDIIPFLTPERAEEIVEGISQYDGWFGCHQTTEYVEDEEGEEDLQCVSDTQFCAGAMILITKMELPNQILQVSERLGFRDPDKLDLQAPVFNSFDEFVEAQRR